MEQMTPLPPLKPDDDGDSHLSMFDRQIWSLVYSTLERFGCLTIFKRRDGDCRLKINGSVYFMVPRDHPRAAEVKSHLEHEAKPLIDVNRQNRDEWIPNTHVKVMYFSGVDYHVDRDITEEMAEEWAEAFVNSLHSKMKGKKAQ